MSTNHGHPLMGLIVMLVAITALLSKLSIYDLRKELSRQAGVIEALYSYIEARAALDKTTVETVRVISTGLETHFKENHSDE